VIGFNAAGGSLYSNHPYSFRSTANEIACISSDTSNYTSVIFKISSVPSSIQLERQLCWQWYFNDISDFGSLEFYYQIVPPCPCTEFQARFDLRWDLLQLLQNTYQTCYISRVIQPYDIGQLCCYYPFRSINGAPILDGQYSGGFLWFHPSINTYAFIFYDYQPKLRCCSSRIGLCDIFQQRRPLQTCDNYQLQKLGKFYA